jgi:hypothetical protein
MLWKASYGRVLSIVDTMGGMFLIDPLSKVCCQEVEGNAGLKPRISTLAAASFDFLMGKSKINRSVVRLFSGPVLQNKVKKTNSLSIGKSVRPDTVHHTASGYNAQ